MNRNISLVTMGQGNVKALRKTLESIEGIVQEFVYGDLLIFDEDVETVKSYQKDFNLKIVTFNFNYIFKHGFSSLLNMLTKEATNNLCLYMNTSEVIDENYGISKIVKENTDCNSFFFIHRTDPHRWYRLGDKTELQWSGRIHEQLKGGYRPYHKPIFMMKDLPKDMDDKFKATIFDTVKELTYFQNYMAIIDNPNEWGETDLGWKKFAEENYQSFKKRSEQKGKAYEAFIKGDFEMLMDYIEKSKLDVTEDFKSSIAIEYQNDKKYLL